MLFEKQHARRMLFLSGSNPLLSSGSNPLLSSGSNPLLSSGSRSPLIMSSYKPSDWGRCLRLCHGLCRAAARMNNTQATIGWF